MGLMVQYAHRVKSNQRTGTKTTRPKADIETERHRLRESKMTLVLRARDLGLAAPRSCCPHPGDAACVSCAAGWLVMRVHRLVKAAQQSHK